MRILSNLTSQAVLVTLVSLAIAGCGKSVERSGSAQAVTPAGTTPMGLSEGGTLRSCEQGDLGQPNVPAVQSFSELALASGEYELVSFEAVGIKSIPGEAAAGRRGFSIIEGMNEGAAIQINPVCHNLSQMPTDSIAWMVRAPRAVGAKDGAITEDFEYSEEIFGPQTGKQAIVSLLDHQTPGASSADSLMSDGKSSFYALENGTIGVYREEERRDAAQNILTMKIFAKYAPKNGPAPETPVPTDDVDNGKGGGQGLKGGGQGTKGKEKSKSKTKKGNANAGNGNAGNSNGNANANGNANGNANANGNGAPEKSGKGGGQGLKGGGQGTSGSIGVSTEVPPVHTHVVHTHSENVHTHTVVPAPDAPAPNTTANENSLPSLPDSDLEAGEKTKLKLKVKTSDGDDKSKTKLSIKEKVSADGDTQKSKLDFKEKTKTVEEDGDVSRSKTKLKTKSKKSVD
jgi:hypothetical protein